MTALDRRFPCFFFTLIAARSCACVSCGLLACVRGSAGQAATQLVQSAECPSLRAATCFVRGKGRAATRRIASTQVSLARPNLVIAEAGYAVDTRNTNRHCGCETQLRWGDEGRATPRRGGDQVVVGGPPCDVSGEGYAEDVEVLLGEVR